MREFLNCEKALFLCYFKSTDELSEYREEMYFSKEYLFDVFGIEEENFLISFNVRLIVD